jgi:hypothetical protein
MQARQTYSIEEIKEMLVARMGEFAYHYAPPAKGSYEDKGKYFTLNPGRADKSVGSFCIHVSGRKAGKWEDFATGQHGDAFDLIGLRLGLGNMVDQLREARHFLGLATDSPAETRQREVALAAARARRAEAEAQTRRDQDRASRRAEAMWLSAEPKIAGTPVDAYLQARGIDLATIGHQPRALRYLAKCHYHFEDKTTGEVIEFDAPAMLAAMTNLQGRTVAVHRTWLRIDPDTGRWTKVRVPHPSAEGQFLPAKKVYGWGDGCAIRLASGFGPKGGKGAPLNRCPPGTRVYIAEGIETALSPHPAPRRPRAGSLQPVEHGKGRPAPGSDRGGADHRPRPGRPGAGAAGRGDPAAPGQGPHRPHLAVGPRGRRPERRADARAGGRRAAEGGRGVSDQKQQVGRVALRVEGDWWVAYYALPNTMDGAIEMGRVLMALVRQNKRKKAFMDLMRSAVGEFLKDATGVQPDFITRDAPEHERAGRA